MVRWTPDDRAERLLRPVRALIDHVGTLFPDAPPLRIEVGPIPDGATWAATPGGVLLSDALEVGVHAPGDQGVPFGLDRWRRAAAGVLEAAATRELARRTGQVPGADWRWVGAAIHAADAAAPELGLALPDLAAALRTGAPGDHPRAGVAVLRAWKAAGLDPIRQLAEVLAGGVVSGAEWAKVGRWVLAPAGLAAQLPGPVDRVGEVELGPDGLALPAWSWRPFRRAADARGAQLRLEGEGTIEPAWAPAGESLRGLIAAAASPARVTPGPGAPIGDWEVASAEGGGQVVGVRGVRFTFRRDGRLEVVLADAFVGPLAALAMAEEVGTSGICAGTWRVAGQRWLRFDGVDARALTLHGRSRGGFLMPAGGFGLAEWLGGLSEAPWAWQEGPADRLVLRGALRGVAVEVRLRREG